MPGTHSPLNIYQMYVQNGMRCGFWVQRNSWSTNVARVTSINGQFEGPLDGHPPYFKNQKVRGDIYESVTGEMTWRNGNSGKNNELTSAGTFGYFLIATPSWSKVDSPR